MNEVEESEISFYKHLTVLAKMCATELDDETIAMYDKNLEHIGYNKLIYGLTEIITSRKARDPFPSIRDVARAAGDILDLDVLAEETTGKIMKAISTKGYHWSDKGADWNLDALDVLGAAGVMAVTYLGGWRTLCETRTDNTVLRAQIKKAARAAANSTSKILDNQPMIEDSSKKKVTYSHERIPAASYLKDMPK